MTFVDDDNVKILIQFDDTSSHCSRKKYQTYHNKSLI